MGRDRMTSCVFRNFLHLHQQSHNEYNGITAINDSIKCMIQSRKDNEPKVLKTSITTASSKEALTIDKVPEALIRECASYLEIYDYIHFSRCNGTIFIACNSPSSLQELDVTYSGSKPPYLNLFPSLKRLRITPSIFNQYPAALPHSSFRNLRCLSVDNNSDIDHNEIKSFLNTKWIDFSIITSLVVKKFGSPDNYYDCESFCNILAQFPNVTVLVVDNVYLTDFNDTNNQTGQLLPKLTKLICDLECTEAILLSNTLIETHSSHLLELHYLDIDDFSNISSLPQLVTLSTSFEFPNLATSQRLVQLQNDLHNIRINMTGMDGQDNVYDTICDLLKKYARLNELNLVLFDDQFMDTINSVEKGLFQSSNMERNPLTIIFYVYTNNKHKPISTENIIQCIRRIINSLDLTEIKHYMVQFAFIRDNIKMDKDKLDISINVLKRQHLVFHEIDKSLERLIICNECCNINGFKGFFKSCYEDNCYTMTYYK